MLSFLLLIVLTVGAAKPLQSATIWIRYDSETDFDYNGICTSCKSNDPDTMC